MIIKTLMLVAIPYTFLDDCRRIALPLGYAIELRSRDFEFQEIVKRCLFYVFNVMSRPIHARFQPGGRNRQGTGLRHING